MAKDVVSLLGLARLHARRIGLADSVIEDCALAFVAQVLITRKVSSLSASPDSHSDAYWHRCAANFARNFQRAETRRNRHELLCTDSQSLSVNGIGTIYHDASAQAEARLLQKEFWSEIAAAIMQLSPAQRALFIRHHLKGESIHEIATAFQRTPHAVEQALLRARQRLRTLLESKGLTVSQLREYVPLPQ